jgi:hypothetical protein
VSGILGLHIIVARFAAPRPTLLGGAIGILTALLAAGRWLPRRLLPLSRLRTRARLPLGPCLAVGPFLAATFLATAAHWFIVFHIGHVETSS